MGIRLGGEIMVVSLAFNQSWVSADPVTAPADWTTMLWTPISTFVRRIEIVRGRERRQNDWQAGTADLILKNTDGRFDPRRDPGYYIDIDGRNACRIDTPIKIETIPLDFGSGAVVYPRFAGITGGFLSQRMIRGYAWVPLKAWDMVKFLNLFPLHCSFPEQTVKERIWAILDRIGFPPATVGAPYYRRTYGSDTRTMMDAITVRDGKAGEEIMRATRTEGWNAFAGFDKTGAFGLAFRNAVFESPFLDPIAVFSNRPGAGRLPYEKINWSSDEQTFFNQVTIQTAAEDSESVEIVRGPFGSILGDTIMDLEEPLTGAIRRNGKFDLGVARVVRVNMPAAPEDAALFVDSVPADIPAGATGEYNSNVAIAADNESQKIHGKREYSGTIGNSSIEFADAMAEDMLQDLVREDPVINGFVVSGIKSEAHAKAILDTAIGCTVTMWDVPEYADEEEIPEVGMTVQGYKETVEPRNFTFEIFAAPRPAERTSWDLDDDDPDASVLGETTDLMF